MEMLVLNPEFVKDNEMSKSEIKYFEGIVRHLNEQIEDRFSLKITEEFEECIRNALGMPEGAHIRLHN